MNTVSSDAERQERITRMKLQTAKVLFAEKRKDAAFLVLESSSDPRAGELREQMGFDNHFEVGRTKTRQFWPVVWGITTVFLLIGAFLLGTLLAPDRSAAPVSAGISECEAVETLVAPMVESAAVDLTGTAGQAQLTGTVISTTQEALQNLIDATDTAAYARETESALATQEAGQ